MTPYVPVLPRGHSPRCERGTRPPGNGHALDRRNCERCRALWQRLIEVGEDARS